MSGTVQFVTNVSSLRQLTAPTANAVIYVEGYYTLNDGGGGMFTWNSVSQAADDGGSVIIPNSNPGSGRWIRQFSDTVSIAMFGAHSNASYDDTSAVQNAINSLPAGGGTITFPAGTTFISGSLSIGNGSGSTDSTRQGVRLKGAGVGIGLGLSPPGSVISFSTGGYALTVNGPLTGFGIEDLLLESSSGGTASAVNLSGLQFGYFRNVSIYNFPGFSISLTNCYKCIFDNIFILVGGGSSANGVIWNGGTYSNTWRNLRVTLTNVSQNGLLFAGVDSEYLINTDVQPPSEGFNAIQFYYQSSNPNFPSNISFFGLEVYSNRIVNNGTIGSGATSNYMWNFSTANGSSVPSLKNLTVIY